MWNPARPIRRDWPSGRIEPLDALYEWDGPVIFTAEIGLYIHLFFIKDEQESGEYFISCMVDEQELRALKDGRLSVRGVFTSKPGWLLQLDFNLVVLAFQELSIDDLAALLPSHGVGLSAGAGLLPDSLDQAESLMAFKFYSKAMSNNRCH
jgi:hypothetical protein